MSDGGFLLDVNVLISTVRGTAPLWSHDGSELYYLAGRAMMAVPVETGASFTAGRPKRPGLTARLK